MTVPHTCARTNPSAPLTIERSKHAQHKEECASSTWPRPERLHQNCLSRQGEQAEAFERAERIFACEDAPKHGDRFQGWCCSYCGYAHLCELAKKDTAVGDESVPTTSNQEVIDTVELLSESRDMEKAAKELSVESKAVLDKLIKQQGIRSVRCDNLILVLN